MNIRHLINLLESENKSKITALKAPADGETGESVTINGFKITKLPSTADFAYSAEKNGKGEKFYSVGALLTHIE